MALPLKPTEMGFVEGGGEIWAAGRVRFLLHHGVQCTEQIR